MSEKSDKMEDASHLYGMHALFPAEGDLAPYVGILDKQTGFYLAVILTQAEVMEKAQRIIRGEEKGTVSDLLVHGLKRLANNVLNLGPSVDGQGRKEAVAMVKAKLTGLGLKEIQKESLTDKLKGFATGKDKNKD